MTSVSNEIDINGTKNFAHDKEATMNYLKRCFNILNEQNINLKKSTSAEIFNFLQSNKHQFDSIFIEQIMNNFGKNILKAMSDNVEKVREYSTKLLNFLLSRCQESSPHLPYIIETLVERTNCHDLEGIQDLPEVMRPAPSQKPHVHVNLMEPTEEIRLEYCETISIIISCCNEDEIRNHVNNLVHILRALSMDPCGEVQVKACQNISQLCRSFSSLLFHFTEMLARAILLPLVNKKSKVRIAALEALGQILYCGVWKYNNTVMEILVGFRDPNVVPIKNFFEYTTNINYFAILIKDAKTNVREFFIRCLGDWLISLPDRYDHEPRLTPYLVSGLFDKDEGICQEAYEIIEEVGLQYEREKEKEFRSIKQLGYESEWTRGGKVTNIKWPKPIIKRPRLGARYFIRNHVRKFLPALYKEVKDWQFENRLEAINLLLFGLIYAEDNVTQFLDKFVVNILHNLNVKTKEDSIVAEKTSQIFYYIGVYCSYTSYLPIMMAALKGEIFDYEDSTKFALIALTHLLTGFFETVIKEEGLAERKKYIYDVIDFLSQAEFLSGIDKESAPVVEEILQTIVESLLAKGTSDDLEKFYKEKRLQAQSISYITIRFRLLTFENKVSQRNFDQDFKSDLKSVVESNLLIKAWNKLDSIFEDLLLDSFIELFQNSLTSKQLSLTQWKIIYTYFMVNISQRQTNNSTYDDVLLGSLHLVKVVDLTSYSKVSEILQMNVLMVKMIYDSFSDEELTKTHSSFLFNAIEMSYKAYCVAEKNSEKLSQFQDKLLHLSKIIFCKDINWSDAVQKFEGNDASMKEIGRSVGELLHKILLTTLKSQETKGKEFKSRVELLKRILTHLGHFLFRKSRYLKTIENNYIVPELINYIVFLHEKFCNDDPDDVLPALFESLFIILMTIPDSKLDSFKGEEWIIPNYSAFLERIIVLTIDAKDKETKTKYKAILKSLCKKTPFNILDQWEKAVKSQSMARIDLLSSLKKEIEE